MVVGLINIITKKNHSGNVMVEKTFNVNAIIAYDLWLSSLGFSRKNVIISLLMLSYLMLYYVKIQLR